MCIRDSNKASYYVDGKAIEENIEVTEYAGGYLGIATWGTSATFQNVTLKVGYQVSFETYGNTPQQHLFTIHFYLFPESASFERKEQRVGK